MLDHTGPHLEAEEYIARTFGAEQSYIVTNGTSTSNKIVGMYAADGHVGYIFQIFLHQLTVRTGLGGEQILDVLRLLHFYIHLFCKIGQGHHASGGTLQGRMCNIILCSVGVFPFARQRTAMISDATVIS